MNQQEFTKTWSKWGENLDRFDAAAIDALSVSDKTKEWLRNGLPFEAAPSLNLGPQAGAFLQSVSEESGLPDEFAQFKVLGFTAYDDPVCLDENTEEIVYFCMDDETEEEEFDAIYVNRSMQEFCSFLVMFRQYVEKIENAAPEDREKTAASTLEAMRAIDAEAMEEGGFWWGEIESFSEEDVCFEDEEE